MKTREMLIAVIVALCTFSAYAVEPDNPVKQQFNKLDTNHDGYISKEEANADSQLTDDWENADTNSDGKINAAEFSAFEEYMEPEPGGLPEPAPDTN